jgi:2-C-methyl-D-erythritol 2,4-cyclodiphosphate synthase
MTRRRVGIGYDVHPLGEGRRLVLGGVEIPHERGLLGHSDGDALTHAIMDALIGAAGQGDIGQWFPPTDERYRGAYSVDLLRRVRASLGAEGWSVENVDATVVAQCPRLAPYVEAMRRVLADALAVPVEAVNVKATTPEGLGALGRQEGIAALATALLARREVGHEASD